MAEEKKGKVFRSKRAKASNEAERIERKRAALRASAKKNKAQRSAYQRRRYKTSMQWRLGKVIRSRMTCAFRRMAAGKKARKSMALLGCSFEQLRLHIQSQFKPGMAWNNYGYRGWHVDHIRPLCTFDLFDPEQQKDAFSYKNLQPMWGTENIQKGPRGPYRIRKGAKRPASHQAELV